MRQTRYNNKRFEIYDDLNNKTEIIKFIKEYMVSESKMPVQHFEEFPEKFWRVTGINYPCYVYERQLMPYESVFVCCPVECVHHILKQSMAFFAEGRGDNSSNNNAMNNKIADIVNDFKKPYENNQKNNDIDRIRDDLRQIKSQLNAIGARNETDYTQDLSDMIDKIDVITKRLDLLNTHTKLLREINDSKYDQVEKIDKLLKTVNSIPGQISFLSDKMSTLTHFEQQQPKEEKKELKIINPDIELLQEMFEASKKINEMILNVAVSNVKVSNPEDVNEHRRDENDESGNESDKNNVE